MFVMMNTLYSNILDNMICERPDNISEENMKAFMKDRVGLLLSMIDEQLPVNIDNDEQTK